MENQIPLARPTIDSSSAMSSRIRNVYLFIYLLLRLWEISLQAVEGSP